MKRNTFLFVLLAILVVQPLIVANLGVFSPGTTTPESDGVFTPAIGTRLTPGEHTNHVPILINGNDDFVAQGWPGSGTSGDPYLISGLNITYANGMKSIEIINTTVYFVIRDCYIDQGSSTWAINFHNASNGVIEHSTVNSVGGGIFIYQSNSTTITNTEVMNLGSSNPDYALFVEYSWDCFVANNVFETPNYLCSWWYASPNPTMNYNSWIGNSEDDALNIHNCNNTQISHSTITTGLHGLVMTESYDPQINNLTITDVTYGMSFEHCGAVDIADSFSESPETTLTLLYCNDSSVVDSTFICPDGGDPSVSIYYSHRLTFTGNTVEDALAYGLVILECEDGVVSSNTFIECEPTAINIGDSPGIQVIGNTIDDSLGGGIEIYNSPRIVVDNNEVTNAETGIYGNDVDNATVIGNTITNTLDGIYLTNSPYNATISDNQIDDAEHGIYVEDGVWCSIHDNAISDVDDGLHLQAGEDLDVYNNIISAFEYGIWFQNQVDMNIHHNTISDADDGIYESSGSDRIRVEDNTLDSINHGITIRGINSSITNNVLTNIGVFGIRLSSVTNCEISGNSISGAPVYGVMSNQDINITLVDNVFIDCGFIFEILTGAMDYYNHTVSGNTVNGLPIYYGVSEEGGSVNLASYGQIILLNCSFIDIVGSNVGMVTVPVQLLFSLNITVSNIISSANVRTINAYQTDNITISDITSIGRDSEWEFTSSAFYFRYCDYFHIENVDYVDGYYGIYLYYSDYGSIISYTTDNSYRGITSLFSDNVTIYDCEITNMNYQGIVAYGDYWDITNCYIYNTTYGIYAQSGLGHFFGDNVLEHNQRGISGSGSAIDSVIHNNEISHNTNYGIYLAGDNWDILNNTILWNGGTGIYLSTSAGTEVFYNIIGLSSTQNGYDTNSQNWDDSVDTGNWWSDYDGISATYSTGGSGTDNYPMQFLPTNPIINDPLDLSYAEGDTGNDLTWLVFDDYLSHYSVSIDGSVWAATSCPDLTYSEIIVEVDGLAFGDHAVTITVWDIEDNTVSHSLTIHVFDDVAPDIDTPPNVEVYVDGDGQVITWTAYDLNPGTYMVMDGITEFATGSWTSGEITIDIDGLTAGVHSFRMIVYDADWNSVSDGVDVLVINDSIAPTIDSPDDIVFVVGSTGNRIIWTPMDEYPATYEVSENSSIFISSDWGGSRIILDIDSLTVGEYTFTLTVFDGSSNIVTDEVNVQVIPYEGWTPAPEPLDATMLIMGIAVAGGVIAVVVIVYFLKIKKPSS